jgi:hypothetical protein
MTGRALGRAITGVAMLLVSLPIAAATPWPEGVKQSYVDRCAESMSSQGLAPKTAKPYCSCIANGMSNEFGMEEYNQMMRAEPSPAGSAYDRRLYKVYSACSSILPRWARNSPRYTMAVRKPSKPSSRGEQIKGAGTQPCPDYHQDIHLCACYALPRLGSNTSQRNNSDARIKRHGGNS